MTMEISAKFPILIFLVMVSVLPGKHLCKSSNSDTVSELLNLQSRSKSGIIHLTDNLFRRLITATKPPRPFSVLVFFDAYQLHSKIELHLKDLKNEYSLLATSFISNNNNTQSLSKLFFCDIEYRESQSTFSEFGVKAVPHIVMIGPNAVDMKSDTVKMDSEDYSGLAESMAQFVEIQTQLTVGDIHRPPIVSSKQFQFLIAMILMLSPFVVKKVISGETILHDYRIYLAGALFVYFFSVSGCMHIIIRKMPMILSERKDPSKLIYFYQGSGLQLGAEGLTIGFLYTIVGILLAFLTHFLVKIKDIQAQRVIMIIMLIICFWSVTKVVSLDNWKTGYSVHAYLPSSWT